MGITFPFRFGFFCEGELQKQKILETSRINSLIV